MSDAPQLARRNHGRGHSYKLDGEKVLSVTQIIGHAVAKPALTGWAARTAAEYAVDHWSDLAELGPSNRLDLIRGAPWRETEAAAAKGTTIHRYASLLAAGEEVEFPPEMLGYVDAYLHFLDDWQVEEVLLEASVGRSAAGGAMPYAGTLDLVARLARFDLAYPPATWIIDVKTGKGVYPEVALQLAAYRFAEFYVDAAGASQPMPRVDYAGVVHLGHTGYEFYPVEAGLAEFRVFEYAQQVARFVIDEEEHEHEHIGAAIAPPSRSEA